MSTLRNKVQLIGNLGMDPEVKDLGNNKKLVKFSLATNENYKNAQGELVKETQWHHVIAWGKLADTIVKYLFKGSEVAIEGKLINNNYTDKAGVKRYNTEVQVSDMVILSKQNKL